MPVLNEKVLFIHIPRTGGTSIEKMFEVTGLMGVKELPRKNAIGRYATQSMTPEEIIKFELLSEEKMFKMFKFCFVRNPWDKLVSDYSGQRHTGCEDFADYIFKAKEVLERFKSGNEECVVSNFLKENCQDNHIRPQLDFIHYRGENIMDFIGRFENYEEDFYKMCEHSGLNKVEVQKVRSSKHNHYSTYYNEELKGVVAKMFAGDIEYFGFEFEEEPTDEVELFLPEDVCFKLEV